MRGRTLYLWAGIAVVFCTVGWMALRLRVGRTTAALAVATNRPTAFEPAMPAAMTSDTKKVSGQEVRAAAPGPGLGRGWREFRREILARSEKDPAAAAAWLLKQAATGGDRAFALRTVMYRWASTDVAAALRWASALKPGDGRECALRAVFAAWSERDPGAAAQALADVQHFETRSLAAGALALQWAAKDVRAAATWAWGLPQGPERWAALAGIVAVLYPEDPTGAVSSTKSIPEGYTRRVAAQSLAKVMTDDDGATLTALTRDFSGGMAPDTAFELRMAEWARQEPEAAAAWAALIPDAWLRGVALGAVAQALARSDPRGGAALASAIPDAGKQADTVWTIAFNWARRDPKAAAGWAADQQAGPVREQAVAGVKAAATPEPETPKATASTPLVEAPAVAREAPVVLPTVNADAFLQPWWELIPLVEQLPDSPIRDGLLHKVAVDWSSEDPVAATAWAMEQMPAGRVADTTLRVVVWNWTARDAEGATLWAGALTDSYYREQALATVAMALVRSDPVSAASVAETLPKGETKSNVISNLVYQWGLVDQEAAQNWGRSAAGE